MKKFSLTIMEHEEHGELGITINNGRDYFEPALNGLVVAHDILEHPVTPHVNGYIDELMALGGTLAGRVYSGWSSKSGRRIDYDDIKSDTESLVENALMMDEKLCPKVSTNYLQSSKMMNEIRSFVKEGILNAINESGDMVYQDLPKRHNFDIDSICGWICKGYQLFNKRFYRLDKHTLSTYFFDKISLTCENWRRRASEYETATLSLDFSSYDVKLVVDEEY
jgi:hypothetical protein